MIWIAPSEKDAATDTLEKRRWESADQSRANSSPILGIIFLRFAEVRFAAKRIQNLRRTRDLLLPAPLSGQIELL